MSLSEHYQVESVTASIGRKMSLEHYGGKKYESEDLFTSVTIKEVRGEELTIEERALLRAAMHKEAWLIVSEQMQTKVKQIKGGKPLSEDGKVDLGDVTPPVQKYTPRRGLTCKQVAETNGVMKRVYEKVPHSCTIIDQIKTKHKWHITPTGIEKLMEKYGVDDNILKKALGVLRDMPDHEASHFCALGDNIDRIEQVYFDDCEGDLDQLAEFVKADKRQPVE